MSLLKLTLAALIIYVKCSDPPPLIIPGHVTIGVLTELRRSVMAKSRNGNVSTSPSSSTKCQGPVTGWALQEVSSLEWALTTINNQSDNRFSIGMKVYDNCGDKDRIIRQASKLLQENEESNSPLLGVIALGSPSLAEATAAFLHAYDIPLVTTQSPAGTSLTTFNNVFTTAPHLYSQIQAVVSVVWRLQRRMSGLLGREHRLGVISGCEEALRSLEVQLQKAGITLDARILVRKFEDKSQLTDQALDFIKSQIGFQGTVVVLLEAEEVNTLARGMFGQLLKRSQTRWIFSILDGESAEGELDLAKMYEVFPDEIIVEPYSPLLPGLNYHIENALRGNLSVVDPLLPLLQERKTLCPPNTPSDISGEANCISVAERASGRLLSGARATAAIKAVSSLAAAFRLVQIGRCPTQIRCSPVLAQDIHKAMLEGLMKLSYNSHLSMDKLRYTADGRLVSSFIISRVTELGLRQIGKYREDTGVVWIQSKETSRSMENRKQSGFSTSVGERENFAFDHLQIQEYQSEEGLIEDILMTHQDYLSRTWFFFVLGVSCVGIFCAIFVGVYVAIKYCDGSITGSQCLGSLLLFGVICVYGSCIVYILPASSMICILRAWLPNLALALCFSVLLVKAMHLKASVSVGVGGEVSNTNLYMSLVFMMGVQVILTLLGHKSSSPGSKTSPSVALDGSGMRQCKKEDSTLLITQGYLLTLNVFGVVFGVLNRKNKKNYNEGRWLLLISGISSPIILCWCGMTILAPSSLETPVSCTVCIVLASIILGLLFLPKMKVISIQSRDFSHKRLSGSPPLSTIFTHREYPSPPLQPPPPFCDPPYKTHCKDTKMTSTRSCIRSNSPVSKSYPFDTSSLISWRDHMQESPCIQRPPAPPPPPPPLMKNSVYYNSSDLCYP